MNASEVQSTLSKYILADGIDIVWDLDRSHGSQIFDAKSQKSFLDLFISEII